jgi:stringent starvation protein B
MSSVKEGMTSNRPYLLRALYEWISDNELTPHILVDAGVSGVDVPQHAVQKGKVVLNIAASATENLHLDNASISFKARFSGKPYPITIPMESVIAIYARENGQGMMFAAEATAGRSGDDLDDPPPRSHLKVVK